MQHQVTHQLELHNLTNQQSKSIEKKIRYLQRELVRASFKGEEKMGLCRKLLKLIKSERLKIQKLNQSIQ